MRERERERERTRERTRERDRTKRLWLSSHTHWDVRIKTTRMKILGHCVLPFFYTFILPYIFSSFFPSLCFLFIVATQSCYLQPDSFNLQVSCVSLLSWVMFLLQIRFRLLLTSAICLGIRHCRVRQNSKRKDIYIYIYIYIYRYRYIYPFFYYIYIYHHHHHPHVTQLARISLSFTIRLIIYRFRQSSRLHAVSVQSCCRLVLAGRQTLARPSEGVLRRLLLMNLSLLLQQCPTRLIWMVLEMEVDGRITAVLWNAASRIFQYSS